MSTTVLEGDIDTIAPSEFRDAVEKNPHLLDHFWVHNLPPVFLDLLIELDADEVDSRLIQHMVTLTDDQLIYLAERAASKKNVPLLRQFARRENISEKALRHAWNLISGRHGKVYFSIPDFFSHPNFPIDCLLSVIHSEKLQRRDYGFYKGFGVNAYRKLSLQEKTRKLLAYLPEEYAELAQCPVEWLEQVAVAEIINSQGVTL